jgi:hypoxanthine phosphoribosyltransferase
MVKVICQKISSKIDNHLEKYETIAITNGGIIPATIISYNLGIKNIHLFPNNKQENNPQQDPSP